MLSEETIFLTGFPGFIASRLVQRFAAAGARLLLLVQPAFVERAQQELERLAETSGRPTADFAILSGDITQPDLGLSPSDLETARSQSTILFHLAAIYDLAVARDIALRVNLGGTRNLNEFARSLPSMGDRTVASQADRGSAIVQRDQCEHQRRDHRGHGHRDEDLAVRPVAADQLACHHRADDGPGGRCPGSSRRPWSAARSGSRWRPGR